MSQVEDVKKLRHIIRDLDAKKKAAKKLAAKLDPNGNLSIQADEHSNYVASRSREKYAAIAEVGPIPVVKNPERREACRLDLFLFLSTYFPSSTSKKPFSEDHRRVIKRIESCCLRGGRYVNPVYRGFAKTTISENSAIWATLYGHRKFVLIIGISMDASEENIQSIRTELAENDLLFEDFPEVCHPIRALDGKPQRAQSQTVDGEHTRIRWRSDGVVLPTIAGSSASGAILRTKPYAKARGVKFKRSDGEQIRPDFIIVDDPQDDVTANSTGSVQKNLKLLRRGILQSAGHSKKLSIVVNASVIARNDMIENLLKDPAWQGERIAMMKKEAKAHKSFWLGPYAKVRQDFDPTVIDSQIDAHERANKLYLANRDLADEGCEISWDYCFDPDLEISAIQHAYNILIDDGEDAFASECQNKPTDPEQENRVLIPSIVLQNANGIDRGKLPRQSEYLTIYIDVHLEILYWAAVGWTSNFEGHICDYGTWPQQSDLYFSQRSPGRTLSMQYPLAIGHGAIYSGLEFLVDYLASKTPWKREDGADMHPGKILIDSKWAPDTVESYCIRSEHKNILMPAKGFYVGPETTWSDYFNNKKGGGKTLYHTRIPPPKDGLRYVLIDADAYKELASKGLAIPVGSPGSWSLYGRPDEPRHVLFADHCCAEVRNYITKADRGKFHWDNPPHRDNHWWDCLCGSAAAASLLGVQVQGASTTKKKREAISLEEMARRSKK